MRRTVQLAIAAAATALHALFYLVPNHFPLREPLTLPMTSVDEAIPFLPATVFVYLSDYLLVFVAFLLCDTAPAVRRFVRAFLSVVVVSAAIHWLFPTTFPRQALVLGAGVPGPVRLAIETLWTVDAPTSCLPSLHVATSLLSALLVRRSHPKAFWLLLGWALAVAGSTLTAKQHYLVDVLAGAAMAALATLVFDRRPLEPETTRRDSARLA